MEIASYIVAKYGRTEEVDELVTTEDQTDRCPRYILTGRLFRNKIFNY